MAWKHEQPRVRLLKLIDRADLVLEQIRDGLKPDWNLLLKEQFGGRIRESGNTYHVTIAGVRASATAGRMQALQAWRAAAARKVEKMEPKAP